MIAIVAAVREEVAALLSRGGFQLADRRGTVAGYVSPRLQVAVAIGGMGRHAAEDATAYLAERFSPALIVSAGFAGAVRHGLRTGDIVVCSRVWRVDGPSSTWSASTAEVGTVRNLPAEALESSRCIYARGECLTLPRVASDPSTKEHIGREFPISVVDMESFWVGTTAARHDIPWAVVRAVLDPLDQPLPPYAAVDDTAGAARMHALGYALSRPWEVPGLIRLGRQARAAGKALSTALGAIASEGRRARVMDAGKPQGRPC